MTMTLTPRLPKVLQPGEGECFQMLSHTFTSKVSASDTLGRWTMYEITDTQDHGAPLHTHPWEETFYILDGELEIQVGTRTFIAQAGASVYIPENIEHRFRVCTEAVRVLVIIPASADQFYRDISEEVTSLPPDLEVMGHVAERHGVKILVS